MVIVLSRIQPICSNRSGCTNKTTHISFFWPPPNWFGINEIYFYSCCETHNSRDIPRCYILKGSSVTMVPVDILEVLE